VRFQTETIDRGEWLSTSQIRLWHKHSKGF